MVVCQVDGSLIILIYLMNKMYVYQVNYKLLYDYLNKIVTIKFINIQLISYKIIS